MSKEIQEIKLIAETVTKKVPEIDLVLLYGSFARGNAHELSDYDIILICDSKKINWSFILNDRVVKAWSIDWETAEKIISGEIGCWSVAVASFIHGKIIWEKNSESKKRLEDIISKDNHGEKKVIEETVDFKETQSKLWQIKRCIEEGKLANIRLLFWDVAIGIAYRLSGLNGQYYRNNWGKQLTEMDKFEIKPENFKERYERMITSEPTEALMEAERLVEDIQQLYRKLIVKNNEQPVEKLENLVMEWSSIIETFNAVKSSAKKDNLVTLLYEITDFIETILWTYFSLQNEVWERNFYYPIDECIPKLPQVIQRDVEVMLQSKSPDEIVEAAENIIKDLKQQFISRKANLPIAKTLQEGLNYLKLH